MITNGEKYACESCIRGHRVAQCQHTDRPLQRVGKKGRPVSQCHHCRSLRTSRSVHTRCKCGSVSRQATLRLFGEERCLCCEGGDCMCAYKTGQKHGGSSTSSLSPTSDQLSPRVEVVTQAISELSRLEVPRQEAMSDLRRFDIGPCLPHATSNHQIHPRLDVSPILPQGAAIQGIPVGNGSCCAQSNAGLDNEYPEHVDDTWIPGEPPQSLIPPEPFEPVIPSISDEAQLYMQILDPSLIADLEFDAWFNHVPEQPDSGTFDPALLDFTPLTFDGHQNREEGFMSPHLGRQWTEREMGDGSDVPALTKEA